ncbi:MAG: tetratricopeptide repeat protein [Rhizobacter sp.]|nr:tetratricopeptide repeat protein [Rhizobacter sp.]
MKRLLMLSTLLPALLLAACASAPPPAPEVLRDDLYPGPHTTATAAEIFAASDEMKRYVDQELAPQLRARGLQRGLLEALYNKRQLRLEYDAERTRNAREAFDARAGNCLSLVIMTSSIARHLGLRVRYRSVYTEETWTRHHGTYFASGHVNIVLGPRATDLSEHGQEPSWIIDFLPPEDLSRQQSREIDETTVAAMYMNNRAAESLAQDDLPAAYGWASAAVRQDPRFLSAYNTLGVIYLRSGHAKAAERALAHVLQAEPRSTIAMANMVRVLAAQGRTDASAAMARTLARLDPEPPFYFYDLGREAMATGDYAAAREWFRKELARAPYHHEFHFWLAVAEAQLGDVTAARAELRQALDTSTVPRHRLLYAAKLDKLNAATRVH